MDSSKTGWLELKNTWFHGFAYLFLMETNEIAKIVKILKSMLFSANVNFIEFKIAF